MWCDSFDGDLYKLVPEAREVLAPVKDVRLLTNGHVTEGALNHPTVWNSPIGLAAFFAFTDHEPGWIGVGTMAPAGYVTDDPLIACTFEQAVRDCWVHNFVLVVQGLVIWHADRAQPACFDLLLHTRGVRRLDDHRLADVKRWVLAELRVAVLKLRRVLEGR